MENKLNSIFNSLISAESNSDSQYMDIVIAAVLETLANNIDPQNDNDKKYARKFAAVKLYEALDSCFPDKDSANHIIYKNNIDALVFSHPVFLNCREDDFEDKDLYERICESKESARIRKDFRYAPEIIVSLTSFPGRIDKVYKSIKSIFTQSMKADRVILWLAESQFPNREADLPKELLEYKVFGLEIRWCNEDIRPHKKYYYAMQEYPDALIITVDDDLIYDTYMIETLFTSYLHNPYAVSAVRTHLIKADENGNIAPYAQWKKEFSGIMGKPSMQLFATSGAGTLYPPHCMDEELFNIEKIKELCINADDLWLKIMQVKHGTPVVLAKLNEPLKYVPESQTIALYHTNERLNENDVQLKNILDCYDWEGNLLKEMLYDNYTENDVEIGVDVVNHNDYGTLDAIEKYMHQNTLLKEKCTNLENRIDKMKKDIQDIRNSPSYKIGRKATAIPRKIRDMIKKSK